MEGVAGVDPPRGAVAGWRVYWGVDVVGKGCQGGLLVVDVGLGGGDL